jgi:AcrR family transcriptional regulator
VAATKTGETMPRILTQTDVANFRDRLCEIAASIFVELGHDGFNMRELARRLGVSAMTPYRYFKNKSEIFAAVRARAFGRFAEHLEMAHATPGSPLEKSIAMGHAYVQFALQDQAHYRLMFDLSQPQIDSVPELTQQELRARNVMTDHARFLVDEGVFEGDPELIGQVLWSALHGVVVLHLAGKLNAAEFSRVLSETMRVLTNAYRPASVPAPLDIVSLGERQAALTH